MNQKNKRMKLIQIACSLLLFSTSFSIKALANDDDAKKQKKYSKSYSISSKDHISLENQFGEMRIATWDKNEVKVDITITTQASTEEEATAILDRISIEDEQSSGNVSFKTHFSNQSVNRSNKNKKNQNQSMKVDYLVYLPIGNPLEVSNKFGPTYLSDYNGPLTITSSFGSLEAGKLANVKKLLVEFGKSDIEAIHNGDIAIKFSQASVGTLSGDIDAKFEFCNDVLKATVDRNIKSLTIKNSYSKLDLDLPKDLSANISITSSYSDFDNNSGLSIKDDTEYPKYGPALTKNYSGGNGNINIKIKVDFGKLTFN